MSAQTLCGSMIAACQAPLSMEFSRQEYWSGLPFSTPGALPDPGIKPVSPALAGEFFTTEPSGEPTCIFTYVYAHSCVLFIYNLRGRNINNLRHADDTILMEEIEEELKSLLMK